VARQRHQRAVHRVALDPGRAARSRTQAAPQAAAAPACPSASAARAARALRVDPVQARIGAAPALATPRTMVKSVWPTGDLVLLAGGPDRRAAGQRARRDVRTAGTAA